VSVYTQCPDCATVFRVTAETLRAAQGDVRCGVCSTTFNALENLSERAFKAAPETYERAPDDSMTVEELPGGENIELSAPVELAVVAERPPAEEAKAAVESEPVEDEEPDDEARAMEFHGDAADLDRLFVVENPEVVTFDPEPRDPDPSPRDLDSTDEHPIMVLDERDEVPEGETIVLETVEPEPAQPASEAPQQPEPANPPPPAPRSKPAELPRPAPPSQPPARRTSSPTAPRILIPDEMRKRLIEEAEARVAAELEFEPVDEPEALLAKRWPWVTSVAALALLLLLQMIHSQRNDLARSETFGPLVAGAYSFFRLTVLAPTDLGSYELRQWGAATDPNESGRLMLRASIVNRASYAQPYPLLRLSLQDRFGGTLQMRDIGPADYLPGAGASGLLGPGQRADALIRIVDPGTEAVGFEMDVCLPAQGGVRCANQVKTARQ
ncbi:MAG: DUF3426 domain-containing protein, partial [Steroidobacteraceae bacterium]